MVLVLIFLTGGARLLVLDAVVDCGDAVFGHLVEVVAFGAAPLVGLFESRLASGAEQQTVVEGEAVLHLEVAGFGGVIIIKVGRAANSELSGQAAGAAVALSVAVVVVLAVVHGFQDFLALAAEAEEALLAALLSGRAADGVRVLVKLGVGAGDAGPSRKFEVGAVGHHIKAVRVEVLARAVHAGVVGEVLGVDVGFYLVGHRDVQFFVSGVALAAGHVVVGLKAVGVDVGVAAILRRVPVAVGGAAVSVGEVFGRLAQGERRIKLAEGAYPNLVFLATDFVFVLLVVLISALAALLGRRVVLPAIRNRRVHTRSPAVVLSQRTTPVVSI